MIASDCANVISSIRGKAMGRHGHVVQEIKARSDEFEKVEFLHEGSRANIDAHRLARFFLYEAAGNFLHIIEVKD